MILFPRTLLPLLLVFPLLPASSQETSPFRQLPPAQARLVEEFFKVFTEEMSERLVEEYEQ